MSLQNYYEGGEPPFINKEEVDGDDKKMTDHAKEIKDLLMSLSDLLDGVNELQNELSELRQDAVRHDKCFEHGANVCAYCKHNSASLYTKEDFDNSKSNITWRN